jgi:hypothetical protein
MRTLVPIIAFTFVLQISAGALAAERASINRRTGLFEPSALDLRKASERGDRAELARAATRLGPARLARLLGDSDRKTVLAALEAVPFLDGGVLLLERVMPLLGASDDAVRARAVAATATLFAQNGPARLAEYEIAPETVSAVCQALANAAANEAEPLSTRLPAIQALLDAGASCAGQLKWDSFFASREPEIRRAAVLAMPDADAKASAALAAALKDGDSRVAGAAAGRLCRAHGPKQAALPQLRDLVIAGTVLPEDVVEMLPCLVASVDPADQRALTELQATGRTAVREAIRHARESRPSVPSTASQGAKP